MRKQSLMHIGFCDFIEFLVFIGVSNIISKPFDGHTYNYLLGIE